MQGECKAAPGAEGTPSLGCGMLALDAHAALEHDVDWKLQSALRPRAAPASDGVIYKAKVPVSLPGPAVCGSLSFDQSVSPGVLVGSNGRHSC